MKYIEILKVDKKIRLVNHRRVVFEFNCYIGKNPGRKLCQDEKRTPEGEYIIVVKNPQSKYFLSLGLNYPNIQDAQAALQSGIIDQLTCDKITQAQKDYLNNPQTIVPWHTAMGGEIYIHGEGDNNKDYTQGCIKLKNKDMQKIYSAAEIGTKVFIRN